MKNIGEFIVLIVVISITYLAIRWAESPDRPKTVVQYIDYESRLQDLEEHYDAILERVENAEQYQKCN